MLRRGSRLARALILFAALIGFAAAPAAAGPAEEEGATAQPVGQLSALLDWLRKAILEEPPTGPPPEPQSAAEEGDEGPGMTPDG